MLERAKGAIKLDDTVLEIQEVYYSNMYKLNLDELNKCEETLNNNT